MGLNYKKINSEIVKIAKGLGYNLKMFDEKGSGPISDSEKAKYVELTPDGIMIDLPQGYSSETDEIYIYAGKNKDKERFLKLIQAVKVAGHMNGLGMTIKNFSTPKVSPKDFADKAKTAREKAREENE